MTDCQYNRIMITGGSGMVGKNIIENLKNLNFEIYYPSKKKCNLKNPKDIIHHLKYFNPDLIIHAAGMVGGIEANINNSFNFFIDNLEMGKNTILASKEFGIKNFINFACSCIYPKNLNVLLEEEMILKGELEKTNEGFALAKLMNLKLCEYVSLNFENLNYKTLIPCNVYGNYDSFDPKRSHLIPAIIYKIHKAYREGKESVEIWGDGTARREFMHVNDLVDATLFIINNFKKVDENIINIGIGVDYSINDYYSMIANRIGFEGSFSHNLEKPTGMKNKLLSNKKIKSLGWSPRMSLKDGISETYKYYLKEVFHEG